jgi:arsenite-transporting ATPase
MKKLAFFLGKGGVGKTTLSSSVAYQMSGQGKKVLILSLDPAHNLGDVFGKTLSNERTPLCPNLDGIEIDLAEWVARYLKESRDEIRSTYKYNVTINLDSYMNILKYSPGTEEYAVLWAIEHTYREYHEKYDLIIFDTPPTALTLRFLAMPSISLMWVRELSGMREKILEKRQTVMKLNPDAGVIKGSSDKKDDRIYGKLAGITSRLKELHRLFTEESYLAVVVNPDNLSVAEALRIRHELEKLEVLINSVCLNKAPGEGGCEEKVKDSFQKFPVFTSFLLPGGLQTMEDLGRVHAEGILDDIQNNTRK